MTDLFLKMIDMSISASYLALAVIAFRLCLKKSPRWITCLLWSFVGIRLMCPAFIQSGLSVLPGRAVRGAGIGSVRNIISAVSGKESGDGLALTTLAGNAGENPGGAAAGWQGLLPVFTGIWIAGAVMLLIYACISYYRLNRQIETAVCIQDNVYCSEYVESPFVLGFLRPRIYVSFRTTEKEMKYVIAHELAHIRRKDHWLKPMGFVLLAVYWFNPVIWVAYILFCRDIETACDEHVIGEMDAGFRADYSQALLQNSVSRRMIAVCPVAFGENGVKERVKHILSYKKPVVWISAAAIVCCAVLAIGFLTDPVEKPESGTRKTVAEHAPNPADGKKIAEEREEVASRMQREKEAQEEENMKVRLLKEKEAFEEELAALEQMADVCQKDLETMKAQQDTDERKIESMKVEYGSIQQEMEECKRKVEEINRALEASLLVRK